jgi:hypothetical protein
MITSIVVGALGYLGMFFAYGIIVVGYIFVVNVPGAWKRFILSLKGPVETNFKKED